MNLKHPKGLYMLSTLEACERFSFYGTGAIIVLYMISILSFNNHLHHNFMVFMVV